MPVWISRGTGCRWAPRRITSWAACTGVHGANRLASNSLLEGLVFGARAAEAMKAPPRPAALFSVGAGAPVPAAEATVVPDASAVRDLMWRSVGLVRRGEAMQAAVAQLAGWRAAVIAARAQMPGDFELRHTASLVTVGLLIARGALRREESRGGHFRDDCPRHDDVHWRKHVSDVLL